MLSQAVLIQIGLSSALFIFIWAVVGHFIAKPFVKVLEDREELTTGHAKQAVRRHEEAGELRSDLETALQKTRMSGISKRESHVEKAKAEAAAILRVAQDRATIRLERARTELERVKALALTSAPQEAQEVAVILAAKILDDNRSQTVH